jgi:selenocysteine-specific translation elongation factor
MDARNVPSMKKTLLPLALACALAAATGIVHAEKADSAKPYWLKQRQEEAAALVKQHTAAHPLVITTSSETGLGIPELRAELTALAEPA